MRKEKSNQSICTRDSAGAGSGRGEVGASTSIWGRPTTLHHKFTVMHYISIRMDVAAALHKIGPHTIFCVCLQLQ